MEKNENELGKKILKETKHEIETLRQMMHAARLDGKIDDTIKLAATIARITRDAHIAQHQADQFAQIMAKQMVQRQTLPSGAEAVLGPQGMAAIRQISEVSKKLGGAGLGIVPEDTDDGKSTKTEE